MRLRLLAAISVAVLGALGCGGAPSFDHTVLAEDDGLLRFDELTRNGMTLWSASVGRADGPYLGAINGGWAYHRERLLWCGVTMGPGVLERTRCLAFTAPDQRTVLREAPTEAGKIWLPTARGRVLELQYQVEIARIGDALAWAVLDEAPLTLEPMPTRLDEVDDYWVDRRTGRVWDREGTLVPYTGPPIRRLSPAHEGNAVLLETDAGLYTWIPGQDPERRVDAEGFTIRTAGWSPADDAVVFWSTRDGARHEPPMGTAYVDAHPRALDLTSGHEGRVGTLDMRFHSFTVLWVPPWVLASLQAQAAEKP